MGEQEDRRWAIGRTDMQSYSGDGEPVHYLYSPDGSDRIPFYGSDCVERATQLRDVLNGQLEAVEDLKDKATLRLIADAGIGTVPIGLKLKEHLEAEAARAGQLEADRDRLKAKCQERYDEVIKLRSTARERDYALMKLRGLLGHSRAGATLETVVDDVHRAWFGRVQAAERSARREDKLRAERDKFKATLDATAKREESLKDCWRHFAAKLRKMETENRELRAKLDG